MTSGNKKALATKKVVVVVALMVVCATIPITVLVHFNWQAAATASVIAALATLIVGVQAGWRNAVLYVVPWMTVTAILGACFPGNPWWAALLVGSVSAVIALSAKKGMSSQLLIISIALGFEVAQPPVVTVAIPTPIFIGLVVLGSTLYSALVVYLATRSRPVPKTPGGDVSAKRAQYFALVLGPFVAIATWIVVHYNLGHAGAWMILTILVIFKPFIQDSIKKIFSRVVGTVGGFVIAITIAETTSSIWVYYVVGVISLIAAITFMLIGRPYWEYAAALTTGIVMMEGATDLVPTAETRLVATLSAAGASLVVMLLLRPVAARVSGKHGQSHY
jgi:hypothetical protein